MQLNENGEAPIGLLSAPYSDTSTVGNNDKRYLDFDFDSVIHLEINLESEFKLRWENTTIEMTITIGNDQSSNRSFQVHLMSIEDNNVVKVSDSCTLNQKSIDSACKLDDDLLFTFGDQISDEYFPSIRIRYDGKFFYT